VTPEYEPLNLGDGLIQIKLHEMLIPDMEPANDSPCEVSNEEHFEECCGAPNSAVVIVPNCIVGKTDG